MSKQTETIQARENTKKRVNNTKIKSKAQEEGSVRHVFLFGDADCFVHPFQLNRSNSLVIFCSADGLSSWLCCCGAGVPDIFRT